MTPAVVYARHSPRPEAEECDSVEKQIERCRTYCSKQGYTIVKEFSDKNMSGGRADNRPGLQAALRETIKHKATLIVYSRDRLARENADDAPAHSRRRRSGKRNRTFRDQRRSRRTDGWDARRLGTIPTPTNPEAHQQSHA